MHVCMYSVQEIPWTCVCIDVGICMRPKEANVAVGWFSLASSFLSYRVLDQTAIYTVLYTQSQGVREIKSYDQSQIWED
jgi:hypothetical protein